MRYFKRSAYRGLVDWVRWQSAPEHRAAVASKRIGTRQIFHVLSLECYITTG